MASTLKHCKTRTKPDVTTRSPRTTPDGLRAARPLAHTYMPPAHPSQRASLRRLATPLNPPPDPEPPDRGRRGLSCEPRGHRVCLALPAPRGHRRRAAPDSDTIVDELRQLGALRDVIRHHLGWTSDTREAARRGVSWECERGDRCSQAAHRCRDRVKIAAFACEGSRRPRSYMLPSARSVLESARLASRASFERGARARKQAGGAMPAMRPARGWHGAARRHTWRQRQHCVGRALKHRRPGRLATY